MAVVSKDALISRIRTIVGDSSSDDVIGLLEDFTDTLADFEGRIGEDWKTKYEQNDAEWRERYRNRFFGNTEGDTAVQNNPSITQPAGSQNIDTTPAETREPDPEIPENEPQTIDELFTEGGV